MIEIKELTKYFNGFCALDEVNLNVETGSVYGLLGPNGAGKTTLIKHLAGVFVPDRGSVQINGEPVFENVEVKNNLIYIPDDLYFFHQYSIKEMASFYAGIYINWNQDRFEKLLTYFPIDINRRVSKLSRGMQKQVAFWLGICTMPDIMILDEPVDGLDPVMRKKVWNLLLSDVAERGTTILVSSHNLRELEDVCSHIGIIYNGKLAVERELDSLKSDIHKIQVGLQEEFPDRLIQDFQILNHSTTGSIHTLIVRGDREVLMSRLKAADPLVLDVLAWTLEEIFIYELGGLGYEIDDVLI